ncbi:MAG: hypothetical protein K9H84_02875 [Bacteroidales bacterium]|nr:hypothetical protein [Bacteroidales bacterium]
MLKKNLLKLNRTKTLKFILPITLVILASVTRLIPHPGNFTPIIAIGLYGASKFSKNKIFAFIVPLFAMLLSDVFINKIMLGNWTLLYEGVLFNYAAIIGVVLMSTFIYNKKGSSFRKTSVSIFSGNFLFYLISNFGVFMSFSIYPGTFQGLAAAYIAGLPFLINQLVATIVWSGVLFGADYMFAKYSFKSEKAIV